MSRKSSELPFTNYESPPLESLLYDRMSFYINPWTNNNLISFTNPNTPSLRLNSHLRSIFRIKGIKLYFFYINGK